MTTGLRELGSYDLTSELERLLLPFFVTLLHSRGPGHCMRVPDLELDLMVRLCGRLRAEVPGATVVILGDNARNGSIAGELAVTSTKLVELRNPYHDGALRPPLLVFVPNDLRAAAEDSFGVATFEEIHLGNVYSELRERLLAELPSAMRGAIVESLHRLDDEEDRWPFADPVSVVRFLLTAKVNGADPEAVGAALYELGLVPDIELLADPARAPQRMLRNRDCVAKLTWSSKSERGRVLDLGLSNRGFRNRLAEFLVEAGLEDPRAWTRRIVLDRSLWGLAFNRWEFETGDQDPDTIHIGGVKTDLPTVADDEQDERLGQLVGQQILPLGPGGPHKFVATFVVNPHPAKVRGLAKFVVQVLSKEQGPVGLVRAKAVWKSASLQASVTFSKLNKVDWEEGWHFVRVLPQTEAGDPIPLLDESGNPIPWAADEDAVGVSRPNESDLFYVLPGGDVEVTLPQRAVQRDSSLAHAQLRLQFAAILEGRNPEAVVPTATGWIERRSSGRGGGSEILEVRFGSEGTVHIPISLPLKAIEQRILESPRGSVNWRVPISLGVVGVAAAEADRWPDGSATDEFLAARAAYFDAVRADSRGLITQGADLRSLRPLAIEYASAYLGLIQDLGRRAEVGGTVGSRRAFADLRRVLTVDAVSLAITDHRGRRREATLLGPTHPLRALWLATWAELGKSWVEKAKDTPREFVVPTRDALLRHLIPLGFPPILPTESGHMLAAIDNVDPFWTLYAPSFEEDPRGLVGDVCSALTLAEPAIGGAQIDGSYLASRVRRYLIQHPYVRTLVINAFNAGRGSVLADMLLHLQRDPALGGLQYNIRLFVPDAQAPGVGEALADLLSPSGHISVREADAFSTASDSHLRPKLQLAVRPTEEFRRSPADQSAHLSFLFDIFPAEEVGAARATEKETSAPVHGLVQDSHVEYREEEAVVAWRKQPRHGSATPIAGGEELTDLLSALSAALSNVTATVATGQTGLGLRPVITLALNADERALLHQVHEVSDWVLTLDRNLGIEFFDHGGKTGRPDYLIDHSPDISNGVGHRLVVTSRSVAELEAMLRPVLQQYGLRAEGRHAVAILSQLRSLSGRLALKLISSSSQRAEALGLALSRMYLEHQGVFENQIVVPLDAHLELYRAIKKHADELGEEVGFRRTDLALFDLDVTKRVIICRLVEVKCYNQVGDVGAFAQLKAGVAEQIRQSEEVLAHHFDPARTPVDRPDRLVKTRQLAMLLEFYLDRAERYGSVAADAAEEARYFLRTLESGYRLSFTRSALIFDFEKPGTEAPEIDGGVEFHRIGVNMIQQLVDAAAPETDGTSSESGRDPSSDPNGTDSPGRNPPRPHGVSELRRRRERAPSIPTLSEAAFLGTPRDRSVSWDSLRSHASFEPERGSSPAVEDRTPPARQEKPKRGKHTRVDTAVAGIAPASGAGAGGELSSAEVREATREQVGAASGGEDAGGPSYDVMLGVASRSPQYGLLGEVSGRRVAIDLNETHTISLFGVQGGGKSYTLGTLVEMASVVIPNINRLPRPLATVIFHYSPTMDYRPEFTAMVAPNSEAEQLKVLKDRYGAEPRGLEDVLLLSPAGKLEDRRAEFPGLEVRPLKFAAGELQASHWRFLMGAVGNQAAYIRQLNRVMKALRDDLSLDRLRQGVDASNLSDHLKDLARMRLDLASEYIGDGIPLGSLVRPGRLLIVDLRDEFVEKDEALGLFVVLLQLIGDAHPEGGRFNKLVVFDEAHKYIESPDLVTGLVEVVREMRHKGTSILVASQDPPSVPVALIELSTQVILHKFNSPAWLKHIQKANASLAGLSPELMSHLRPGEAFVWSSRTTDEAFTNGAVKIRCRPRVTQHGGATKTAT
jgi:hypothetical protein